MNTPLQTGQIVRIPDDGCLVLVHEMGRRRLGDVVGLSGGTQLLIVSRLAAAPGIAEGDYMACVPGRPVFYALPGRMAEEWARYSKPDRLTAAIDSALCMLCEGPDAIGGREAREQATKILLAAKKG